MNLTCVFVDILEKGDGSRIYLDATSQVLTTVVGNDQQRPISCPFCNEPARYLLLSERLQRLISEYN